VAATDPSALRITADVEGSRPVLRLAGELDLATADLLRERVHALLGRGSEVTELVLDVAGLEFLDVTGLGALLEVRRKLVASGGALILRRPRPMVLRMLDLLQLGSTLQIEH
jgi:anti-sigma B factor antagonist